MRFAVFPFVCCFTATAELPVKMSVDFSRHLREWDGFGTNYVRVAQTRDYQADPQEYGGFSLLTEDKRHMALDLIFSPDGLKPDLAKMFLDPYHEPVNDNPDLNLIDMSKFDHATTTEWMRAFVREGLKRTRARGADLRIVTTLYGPPPGARNRSSSAACTKTLL